MRNRPWLIAIVGCLLLVLVLGFIKFTQIRAAIAFGESFPEPSETVQSTLVEFQVWQPEMVVVGDVRASREVELRNELPGLITKVAFSSGSLVEEGDLLLQLDISQESAELQAAQADLALAKANFERFSGFKNPDAVSRQQVDQARAQYNAAQGNALAIQSLIDRKTIRAPFAAFTGIHQFENGQFLAANTLVSRLVGSGGERWVDFAIPQQYANVEVGQQVTLQATAQDAQALVANVIAVEKGISRASRAVAVRAALKAHESNVKPGTIVSVSVPIGPSVQSVVLPSSAVRVDTFGPYVFILEQAEDQKLRAARRSVVTLTKEREFTVIKSGLEEGEQVATQGAFKLRDGIWVKLAEADSNVE